MDIYLDELSVCEVWFLKALIAPYSSHSIGLLKRGRGGNDTINSSLDWRTQTIDEQKRKSPVNIDSWSEL